MSQDSEARSARGRVRIRAARLVHRIRDEAHLIRMGHYVQAREGFPNDAALAAAFPVHRSRIVNWKQGEPPDEEDARLLRDLAVVVDELAKIYDREVILDWLYAERPGGLTPMELLRRNQLAEVLHLINAAATGAYS